MIAWLIAQIAVLGLLLSAAAFGTDAMCWLAGKPMRWAWLAALALLMLLGALAPLRYMPTNAQRFAPPALQAATAIANHTAPSVMRSGLNALRHELSHFAARVWQAWNDHVPPDSERWLLIAWILASAAASARFVAVYTRHRRRCAHMPIARIHGTDVRVSDATGPALIGLNRPQIVVPRWLLARTAAEQQMVLEHELEHLRRRDPLLLVLAQGAVILLPWHPAVWWMAGRLRLALELDCDARVLNRGASPREYGRLLIELTDRCASAEYMLPTFATHRSQLERRLVNMTPSRIQHRSLRFTGAAALAFVAAVSACTSKVPVSESVQAITLRRSFLGDSILLRYFVNNIEVSKDSALRIPPSAIAAVNSWDDGVRTHEMRVITRSPANEYELPADGYYYHLSGDTASRFYEQLRQDSDSGSLSRGTLANLISVNGVITPYAVARLIEPARVESLSLLESAAAVSKYHTAGAENGVFEIVTRRDTR